MFLLYSLNTKGDQRNSNHQQVQEVEIIPAECSFVEKSSVCCHLMGRTEGVKDFKKCNFFHSQIRSTFFILFKQKQEHTISTQYLAVTHTHTLLHTLLDHSDLG